MFVATNYLTLLSGFFPVYVPLLPFSRAGALRHKILKPLFSVLGQSGF